MLINKPFAALLLAAVATAAAAPAADASRTNPLAHFAVTASGSIDETWTYTYDGASSECRPLRQGSGSAHIDFASPKPKKLIVALYDGVKGSVPVTGTRSRQGTFGTHYRDPSCDGWQDEVAETSSCGTSTYRGKLDNFAKTYSSWGFNLDVPTEGFGCPTPPGYDLLAGNATSQAVHDGPRWEWQLMLATKRRGATPKKVQTVTYKDHRVIPFKGASGQRVIDVTWKVTFKRLDSVH
jgi:hypothetical protein